MFSFGLIRSNVSKAKRRCVAGEERKDDDRPETEEREDDREDDRPETKTELELRQPDTGSNGQTTSDRQRIKVVASRCPELSDDLGRITISQAKEVSVSFVAKTYMRTTMGENRLTALALLHTKYNMPLDLPAIINIFAGQHPRRMTLSLQ